MVVAAIGALPAEATPTSVPQSTSIPSASPTPNGAAAALAAALARKEAAAKKAAAKKAAATKKAAANAKAKQIAAAKAKTAKLRQFRAWYAGLSVAEKKAYKRLMAQRATQAKAAKVAAKKAASKQAAWQKWFNSLSPAKQAAYRKAAKAKQAKAAAAKAASLKKAGLALQKASANRITKWLRTLPRKQRLAYLHNMRVKAAQKRQAVRNARVAAKKQAAFKKWFNSLSPAKKEAFRKQQAVKLAAAKKKAALARKAAAARAKARAKALKAKKASAKNKTKIAYAQARALSARHAARNRIIIAWARALSGIYYRSGGATPSGFDCSGYVMYIFRKVGIHLTHIAQNDYLRAHRISRSQAVPGDLVFFHSSGTTGYVYHVGIYAGNGYLYHSPHTGTKSGKYKIWTNNISFGRI
jgi:cell wall-associated NlpC family hydrolase